MQVGDTIEGKVTGVTKFGAFVDVGEGKSGMVHVSEISNTFVKEVSDFVKVGDTVKAVVLNIDDKGKISLSMKKLLPPEERAQKPENGFRGQSRGYQRRPKQVFNGVPDVVDWGAPKADLSFEEMMSKYKQRSEEKISDLKKITETKRNSGKSRRK